jgi:DNA repair photolyase
VRLGPVRLAPAAAQLGLAVDARHPLPTLDLRDRGTEFLGLPSQRILNSPETTGMPFWTINPYVGCEFGCCYCYARATHEWTAERHGRPATDRPARERFEREIFVKRNAGHILQRTLDPAKVGRQKILIGSATDPYQPAERRFGVTRSVLEGLLGFRGLSIGIITKSPLVARDADLLGQLALRHRLTVQLSLISLDPGLIRRLEPRTPLPHARLRAVTALAEAGVNVGLIIAPIIPGLTDGWGSLGGLMAAGKGAGARHADGFALRLKPVARSGFLPVLMREFPELVARYQRRYGSRNSAGKDYLAALDRRIRTLQQIHGFPIRPLDRGEAPTSESPKAPPSTADAELALDLA